MTIRGNHPDACLLHHPGPDFGSSGSSSAHGSGLRSTGSRPRDPKRVRNGVRLDSGDIPPGTTERSQAWIRLFRAAAASHVFDQGLEYARRGQAVSLDITPGRIRARVQGAESRPYTVEMTLTPLSVDGWNRLIGVLAEQSRIMAQVLSGRLPNRVDRIIRTFGIPLVPERLAEMEVSCTCNARPTVSAPYDPEVPMCKHMVAVALLVGQELEQHPLTACTLRGMEASHLVERLRLHRSTALTGARVESVPPLDPPEAHEPAEPLTAHLEDFWTLSDEVDTLANRPQPPAVPHTLLRRLGPSPMADRSRFPIAGLLATCYDLVTEHILEIQQQAMGEGDEGDKGASGEEA